MKEGTIVGEQRKPKSEKDMNIDEDENILPRRYFLVLISQVNNTNILYSVVLDIILYLYKRFSKIGLLINSVGHLSQENSPLLDDVEILHHSKNFLFVNKQYDVLINSNNPQDKVTVQTQLKKLVPELINPNLGHDFNFVHRLDYATSGILCIPTNKKSCRQASCAFEKHRVDKYYLAIVRGHISQELIEVNIGIGNDIRPDHSYHMVIQGNLHANKVRSASTRILVLEKGISHGKKISFQGFPATKVLLKPLTGRRHQLRLHLSILGHTIVGDYTYSNRNDIVPYRMFLHAFRLVIPTELEHTDIQTRDPFCETYLRNKWISVQKLNKLDEEAMSKIRKVIPDVVIKAS
ncbi:RNA pseudouridylate synthase domain-containing protein 1 [Armadillidium nasatum]|uniref:RNA pseudouridylate synthase domain-containing protein 1 n=1 Tax=Armadillidium nasatum TaxID=96803 RepID=A0A5N5T564_9CRUS|nr:RNA pseudouridylate synthase domain-containing protein 1 [Armadillidium nasatum]